MTIELSENVIEAIADAVVKKMQQQSEDYISREEVLKLLGKEDWADTVEGVLALPSVTPKQEVEDERQTEN